MSSARTITVRAAMTSPADEDDISSTTAPRSTLVVSTAMGFFFALHARYSPHATTARITPILTGQGERRLRKGRFTAVTLPASLGDWGAMSAGLDCSGSVVISWSP
jgi:hypothetical protein